MSESITRVWNATLYLRLSREDGDKEESNSITGQRELLRDYLRRHPDLREYAVRVDDGWSGSDFQRPDFQAMMEDVKSGKTDCIIVKDLSRFGRNYLDAGEYIEKVFPLLGVRFIAVNDGYDSMGERKASDDLIIPFKNMMNEGYCRDISIKIRSQLEIKRKSGQFIGAFAAYGYLKDPERKNHLIVDDYAADLVREMFHWKLEGVSPGDIAARLNELGVLAPAEYKRAMGQNFVAHFQVNAKALWSAGSVLRVLKNPVYTGALTQGKVTTPSYKIHKRFTRPENEWAVIEHSHEAIINSADFDTVQKVLALDTRRGAEETAVSLFSGMVLCGECGASMVRKTVTSGGRKYVYYVCSAHKRDKSCLPHRIRDTELEGIVLTALQSYIQQVVDLDELLDRADSAPLRAAEAQKLQRQFDARKSELDRANKLLMSLYENLTDGVITREEYARLKQGYSLRAEEAERRMNALQDAIHAVREKDGGERPWIEQFRKHENLTRLERSIVVSLMDRVLIHADKQVEIRYRWQDEFAWQTDLLQRTLEQEAI